MSKTVPCEALVLLRHYGYSEKEAKIMRVSFRDDPYDFETVSVNYFQ